MRGEKKKFLGMAIESFANRRVSLFMKDYIEESIAQFGEALDAKLSSPDTNVLHNINLNSPRLDN